MLADFMFRFSVDVVALVILIFGLYYRRYADKELVTTAALFNVFVYAILTMLSTIEFSLAAGFGLFAILALFTLRSETFTKVEITYFFGSIAIAVICSIQGTDPFLVLLAVSAVLIGAYFFDHPKLLRSVTSTKVVLDRIDDDLLSDVDKTVRMLTDLLNVKVLRYSVTSIDYINERAQVRVFYQY